jgi:hypothetical protein
MRHRKWADLDGQGLVLGVAARLYGADYAAIDNSWVAVLSSVNDSATSQTLLAANASRKAADFFNDSDQALYLKLGATATSTSFTVKLLPGAFYEMRGFYRGVVDGIWAADSSGAARITEYA